MRCYILRDFTKQFPYCLPVGPVGHNLIYFILSSLFVLLETDKILKVFVNMKRTSSARKTAGESKVGRYRSPKNEGIPNND